MGQMLGAIMTYFEVITYAYLESTLMCGYGRELFSIGDEGACCPN